MARSRGGLAAAANCKRALDGASVGLVHGIVARDDRGCRSLALAKSDLEVFLKGLFVEIAHMR